MGSWVDFSGSVKPVGLEPNTPLDLIQSSTGYSTLNLSHGRQSARASRRVQKIKINIAFSRDFDSNPAACPKMEKYSYCSFHYSILAMNNPHPIYYNIIIYMFFIDLPIQKKHVFIVILSLKL
jgi:hypothetical protein